MGNIKRIRRYAGSIGVFAFSFVTLFLIMVLGNPKQGWLSSDSINARSIQAVHYIPYTLKSALEVIEHNFRIASQTQLLSETNPQLNNSGAYIDIAITQLDKLERLIEEKGEFDSKVKTEIIQSVEVLKASFNDLRDQPAVANESFDYGQIIIPLARELNPLHFFSNFYFKINVLFGREIYPLLAGFLTRHDSSLEQALGDPPPFLIMDSKHAYTNIRHDWLSNVIRLHIDTLDRRITQIYHNNRGVNRLGKAHWFFVFIGLIVSLLVLTFIRFKPGYSKVSALAKKSELINRFFFSDHLAMKKPSVNNQSSNFVYGLEEEVRNMINGLMGIVKLLYRSGLNARQKHFTHLLDSTARSLLGTMGDISDFRELKRSELKFHRDPFDLHDLLMKIADTCAVKAIDKEIEFILDLDPTTPMLVSSDATRLAQVIENISTIAIKLLNHGEVVLGLSTENISETNCNLIVSVQFKVSSIIDGSIDAIAHNFYVHGLLSEEQAERVHQSLMLCESICVIAGGSLIVEYHDHGTVTFLAAVPVGLVNEWRMGIARARLRGVCVLLLTRNAAMYAVLARLMKFWSIDALACQSTEELESKLNEGSSKHLATVVIADDKIGHECLLNVNTIIKKSKIDKSPNLIIMTTVVNPYTDAERLQYGALSTLTKPIKPVELISVINQALFSDRKDSDIAQVQDTIDQNNQTRSDVEPKVSVLVVEDNQINQLVLEEQLKEFGFKSVSVSNGQEAINELLNNKDVLYSLILMDCMMPVMDGYEATKRIRNGECGGRYKIIPVIALTGSAKEGNRDKCINAGMTDYLTKPVAESLLHQTLLKWVDLSQVVDPKSKLSRVHDGRIARTSAPDLTISSEIIWNEALVNESESDSLYEFLQSQKAFDTEFDNTISALRVGFQNESMDQVLPHIDYIDSLLKAMGGVHACSLLSAFKKIIEKGKWKDGVDLLEQVEYECRLLRYFSERAVMA